eukprot:m.209876 g.209876  ORF g.209876 m.209876 type:complete len:316 (+) comp53952_c0_seq7:1080-2027(+)
MWPTGNKTTTALVVKPSKGFSFGLRFLLWFCCGESATSVRLMATSFAPRLVITSAERLRAAFAESIHRDIYGITLQYDRITDAGLALLLPDLERCANLHELDLTGNDLTSASLPAVRAIILACPTLIRFHLNKAGFTCSGANKFSATDALFVLKEALTHKTLHHLSFIKRNAIPELHGVYIAHRHPEEVIPAEREQEFLENLREISFHLGTPFYFGGDGRLFWPILLVVHVFDSADAYRCRLWPHFSSPTRVQELDPAEMPPQRLEARLDLPIWPAAGASDTRMPTTQQLGHRTRKYCWRHLAFRHLSTDGAHVS